MKKQLFLLAACCVLLLACGSPSTGGRAHYVEDAMALLDEQDYVGAEHIAYAAALSARDSTEMREALSLLSFVYLLEQKDDEARMLMSVVPADGMAKYIRLQEQTARQGRSQQRWLLLAVMAGVAVATGCAVWWYRRRTARISAEFQQKVSELERMLSEQASSLADHEQRVPNMEKLKSANVDATKMGVDVLYAILHDQNISQMGRREQQAVMQTVHIVDPQLEGILTRVTLTPKETFFCIMEHYGKSDAQKARCFCCSEQAIRSTKSRLRKKLQTELD